MSEPLDEAVEESFIEALNRFDVHIWPLFEARGYTKGEALIVWHLNRLENEVDNLREAIEEVD